jgi:hypothetical protein
MLRTYYFCVRGSRSHKSHAPIFEEYYKVQCDALLSAWRVVREKVPHGTIYALNTDAEKRYKDKKFTLISATSGG